jgi:hypothetical protein
VLTRFSQVKETVRDEPDGMSNMRLIQLLVCVVWIGSAMLLTGCSKVTQCPAEFLTEAPVAQAPWISGPSADAFLKAVRANKNFFVYFKSRQGNERKFQKSFEAAIQKMGDRAESISVDVDNGAESAIVQKYRLQQAPMPLVLAFASNGAMLGGFPKDKISEEALVGTVVSPCLRRCLRALQDGKLVLVCATSADLKDGKVMIPKGVVDFNKDPQYQGKSTIITVDPADPTEQKMLALLQVDPATQMSTCLLVPPGSLLSKWTYPVKKKELEAALAKASSGGGCSPGACAPGAAGCPPPKK